MNNLTRNNTSTHSRNISFKEIETSYTSRDRCANNTISNILSNNSYLKLYEDKKINKINYILERKSSKNHSVSGNDNIYY